MEDSAEDVLVGVMVVMVVVVVVVVGGEIFVVEVMNADNLMGVMVVEEDCLMRDPAHNIG